MNLPKEELKKETEYLNKVLHVVRTQISELGQELYEKEEKVQEFKKFIWDSKHDMDPTEMRSITSNNDLEVSRMMRKGAYLQKLFRLQKNPYFGFIDFDDGIHRDKIYIGITHVEEDLDYLVHDWRAPICSLFYDYEVGPAEFISPDGIVKGNLKKKRQFKIQDGELIHVFDNSINIDDDLLQEVLATESSDKMKNIVNTIQQEQNAIIRNTDDKNLIVQGIAGSGKTSVALHRIAFLLYKIPNLNSNNVLVFSPNEVFTEYISDVLPELGEDNTMQTTFSDFLEGIIKEYKIVESFTSFVERYYKYIEKNKELVAYKQSDRIINDIDLYIEDLKKKVKFTTGIEHRDFVYSKEMLNHFLKERYSSLPVFERIEAIALKICNDVYEGKRTNQKKIEKMLFEALNIPRDIKKIYTNFFRSAFFHPRDSIIITEQELKKIETKKEISYEDACLFVYVKGNLEGFAYRGLIKEVVIDEAQDYNKLQYKIITTIFKRSSFTILGDINQTINPYYHYQSLEDLKEVIGDDTKYLELTKTYRSSEEIVEHTNHILGLSHVSAIRHQSNHPVLFRKEGQNLKEQLLKDIHALEQNSSSIAIITKTDDEATKLYSLLKEDINDLELLTAFTKKFNRHRIIIPSYVAKGLEFDGTIVYTEKASPYKEEEKYLYYVACTRSQHQLIIYNQ